MVQWLRIRLAMLEIRVPSLDHHVLEGKILRNAAKFPCDATKT